MLLSGVAVLFCLLLSSQARSSLSSVPKNRIGNAPSVTPAGSASGHQDPLTIHVLNVLTGLPAPNMAVKISLTGSDSEWTELMKGTTDSDGRLGLVPPNSQELKPGIYKVRFETGDYWQQQGFTSFYPYVEVVFKVAEGEKKVHIPLMLSRFFYSTYKGS